jgi:hypothetical protein
MNIHEIDTLINNLKRDPDISHETGLQAGRQTRKMPGAAEENT